MKFNASLIFNGVPLKVHQYPFLEVSQSNLCATSAFSASAVSVFEPIIHRNDAKVAEISQRKLFSVAETYGGVY